MSPEHSCYLEVEPSALDQNRSALKLLAQDLVQATVSGLELLVEALAVSDLSRKLIGKVQNVCPKLF